MPTIQEYGPPITLEKARRAAEAAEAEARRHGWAVVIAVVDSGSHLVLLHRMDHTQYGSIAIAQSKATCAVDFKRPTRTFEDALLQGGSGWRTLSVDGICPYEGGIPIVEAGKVVGGIGVSGARSDEDGIVAAVALAAIERA
jgi:glc operon protein GlcG